MNLFAKHHVSLFFVVFIIIILFLVLERFYCHYYQINIFQFIFNFCQENSISNSYLWKESGFVENLQSLFLIFSIFFLISASIKIKKQKTIIYYFIIVQYIGLIYFLGEEISWGQHILHWQTPEIFTKLNHQNETNVHNISNLFNELPRTLVLLWCSFSSITIIYFKKIFVIENKYFIAVCPNKNLIFISLLLIFFVLPDLIISKFGLSPKFTSSLTNPDEVITYLVGERPVSTNTFNLKIFYEKISFNFFRLSELHELIFCYYFFIYSFTLKKKLKN